MNNDLISLEPIERREPAKIKTHFARIIVGGQIEKPCYSILWFDPADREYQIGYSSYELRYVQKWLAEEFVITGDGFTNEPMVHARWRLYRLNVPGGKGQTYSVWGCSACHKHERKRSDYCPNCGAKMDGAEDHA